MNGITGRNDGVECVFVTLGGHNESYNIQDWRGSAVEFQASRVSLYPRLLTRQAPLTLCTTTLKLGSHSTVIHGTPSWLAQATNLVSSFHPICLARQ